MMQAHRVVLPTVRRRLLASAAFALIIGYPHQATAQVALGPQDQTPPRTPGTPPPGFEDLEQATDTLFDVSVLGRRIGAFRGVLSNGTIEFASPEAIADALAALVERDAVIALLSNPLPTNEQLRCYPGQTVGCGLLPVGQYGLIADPQLFSVEIFFDPATVRQDRERRLTLGPSSAAGPSLVQNVAMSVSSSGFGGDNLEVGGTFETLASVGATSLVAQTFVGTGFGARLNQGHVQHIWGSRIARAGLIEDYNTALLANYRMVGGEFGSFYPRMAYDEDGQGTPLDIILSRDADVEIRRNGVLISARRYAAGPQRLDTSGLPNGSYSVQIVARADGVIILDEVRNYSRSAGLPIAGETEFSVRAGLYVEDRFNVSQRDGGFLPSLRQSPVVGIRAARRIAASTSIEVNLMNVDGLNVGEATAQTFLGSLEGSVSVAVADDGSYGATVTGSVVVSGIRFNLAARTVQTEARFDPLSQDFGRYQPFLRREDSVVASTQFLLLGGTMGVSGGYSRSPELNDRYTTALRYSRAIEVFRRPGFLSAFALKSDSETRVGASLTFNFGIGPKTTASVTGGGEAVTQSNGSARRGFSPIAAASISRRERWQQLDVLGQANISTSADGERLGAGINVASPYGLADLNAQYVRNRSGNFTSLVGNAQSGFAIGGGAMKLGLARPGEAVILTDLDVDAAEADAARESDSGYRVRINSQSYDLLRPGRVSAAGVAAFDEYDVSLAPENAPPFDVRIDSRRVIVYPGNVVRLRYSAQRDVSIFGQLVSEDGTPLARARLRGGNDLTVSDENGYFTLTLPIVDEIEIVASGGRLCSAIKVNRLVPTGRSQDLHRVGQIICVLQ